MGCKGSWVRIPLARLAGSCSLSTAWLVCFTGFEPTTPSGSDAVERRPCCRAETSARETAERAAGTGRIPLARLAGSCSLSTAWLVCFTGFEPTTPSGSDAVERRPCCRAETSARETAERAAGTGRIPLARLAESCAVHWLHGSFCAVEGDRWGSDSREERLFFSQR